VGLGAFLGLDGGSAAAQTPKPTAPPDAASTDGADDGEDRDEAPPAWHVDPQGRTFRVGFDPGSRWLLGGGLAASWSGETGGPVGGQLETGVLYRHIAAIPAEGAAYKLYHEALLSRLWLDEQGASRLSTTLYTGRFMRWSRDGRIVLPTSPPKRVPFPMNIGLEAAIGDIDFAELGSGYGLDIGVLRAELLLDVWRRRRLGSYAQFGLGPSYQLRLWGRDEELGVDHVVAPFTQGSFALRHESADGRHSVGARLYGGYALSSEHGSGGRAGAAADYEAIVIAVNDLPISGFVARGYGYESIPRPTRSEHALSALAGLRLSVPLHW